MVVQTRSQTKKLLQQQPQKQQQNESVSTATQLTSVIEQSRDRKFFIVLRQLLNACMFSSTNTEKLVNITKLFTYLIDNIGIAKNPGIEKLWDICSKKIAEFRRSIETGEVCYPPQETLDKFVDAMNRMEATFREHNMWS
jgi:hypothetical protein